jgi:hypothetical protein
MKQGTWLLLGIGAAAVYLWYRPKLAAMANQSAKVSGVRGCSGCNLGQFSYPCVPGYVWNGTQCIPATIVAPVAGGCPAGTYWNGINCSYIANPLMPYNPGYVSQPYLENPMYFEQQYVPPPVPVPAVMGPEGVQSDSNPEDINLYL